MPAIDNDLNKIDSLTSTNDKKILQKITKALINLALLYLDLGGIKNLDEAIKHLEKSIFHLSNQAESSLRLALALNNMSVVYREKYMVDQDKDHLDKSLEYANQALELRRLYYGNKLDEEIAESLYELSMVYKCYSDIENFEKSLKLQYEALKICEELQLCMEDSFVKECIVN